MLIVSEEICSGDNNDLTPFIEYAKFKGNPSDETIRLHIKAAKTHLGKADAEEILDAINKLGAKEALSECRFFSDARLWRFIAETPLYSVRFVVRSKEIKSIYGFGNFNTGVVQLYHVKTENMESLESHGLKFHYSDFGNTFVMTDNKDVRFVVEMLGGQLIAEPVLVNLEEIPQLSWINSEHIDQSQLMLNIVIVDYDEVEFKNTKYPEGKAALKLTV